MMSRMSTSKPASAAVTAAYLMICAALGYFFGDLADAGWAVLIGALAPYALFYAVTLFGLTLGAEPSRMQRRRPRRFRR